MNKLTDGWLIPTIKMLKAIRRQFFPQMGSFHLEILAWRSVPNAMVSLLQQHNTISYPVLISSFFEQAKQLLAQPIKLNGSNSPAQNIKLGNYPLVFKAFDSILGHCQFILQMNSEREQFAGWREIFGDLLPSN